ncbi:hypothetical protein llap_18660 [Limosa lapponica baueri]|uniref:Uncharacterized protein n=1 Tax=Limosa lapponica baueri TaxID=1758121 RepID=A0A2I0TB55_LIMLA|nr:hypothetical protein llap_18660 [Limosa lapponica baueri]
MVCNCDKYLKVSRERMKQLVEGSRQAPGDSGTGVLMDGSSSALGFRCPDPTTCRAVAMGSESLHRAAKNAVGFAALGL